MRAGGVKETVLVLDRDIVVTPEELKRRRLELGYTTPELARIVGTTPTWIVAAEKGRKPLASSGFRLVRRYLEALGFIRVEVAEKN